VGTLTELCRWLRRKPGQAVWTAFISLLFGYFILLRVLTWYREHFPPIEIQGVVSLSEDGRTINVTGLGDDSLVCWRHSAPMVYPLSEEKVQPGQERHYTSLGGMENGLIYPDAVPHYAFVLPVPEFLRGPYMFVIRSENDCWHGWVRYPNTTTPPVLLHLGWN
jgi:hypothetical protein